jgi:alkyl hydroperoxide reductase subunit AhpC
LQARVADFERVDAQVLGISVDSVPCHEAWAASLGGVTFPLLSDLHRRVCARYGVLWKQYNIARRAVVLVDRSGITRYIEIFEKGLPDPDRLLSVLRATGISASKKKRAT